MRASIILASLPMMIATPALAQHQGHPMPAADAPAPKAPQPPPSPPPTAPPAEDADAMPAMDWPTNAPANAKTEMEEQLPMEGMDHSKMEGMQPTPGMPAMDHSKMEDMQPAPGMPAMDHSKMEGMQPAPGAAVMDHSGMDMGQEEAGNEPPPPAPTDHAADRVFGAAAMGKARDVLREEHGGTTTSMFMLKIGEWQVRDGENGYRWDGEAWFGGDYNRLVLKSEGEGGEDSGLESGEIQALYSRAISPYFDLQAGIRQDFQQGPKRTYVTVGFEGLAPYWFDTEGALFLSNKGELLGRIEGTYDLRLTQRWILQPLAEVNFSAQDIPEMEIGSGLSDIELGLRLRYEIKREFAPYIGVSFERKFGDSADFARARGEDVQATSIVVGIRAWF